MADFDDVNLDELLGDMGLEEEAPPKKNGRGRPAGKKAPVAVEEPEEEEVVEEEPEEEAPIVRSKARGIRKVLNDEGSELEYISISVPKDKVGELYLAASKLF